MNFWEYVTTPLDGRLGPIEGLLISLSLFATAGGILLVILPGMIASSSRLRSITGHKEVGREEYGLRTELRVKVGIGIVVWSSALILSLLLRGIGTPGLTTRWLPMLVILVLPLLVGYVIVYRLIFYPRYLKVCRQIDTRKSYEPTTKKSSGKKARTEMPQKQRVNLMPGMAMIGASLLPLVYYILTSFVSIPPGVPTQNHDHAWHQLGTLLTVLLGYLIGLALSLGSDVRTLLPLAQMRRT